ncbi:JAB domain-containing protein [Sporosarcina koreensis]|uniref:JAB domain-containing protein n=1 Tax=Sporosarcina koreensis TaxID=334735 RepID=UPI00069357DF|nr:DNA repair protein RadC [Sporosarcina koreensis]
MTIYSEVKEKFSQYSKESISVEDSLTMLVGPKAEKEEINKISKYRLQQLLDFSVADFVELGISPVSSKRVVAALSLVRQLADERIEKTFQIKSPKDAVIPFLKISYEQREVFAAVFLDTKNRILHYEEIFKGTLNTSIVHPRELYRMALKYNAASIIIAHNHPSSDLNPSSEDIEVTRRLRDVGEIMGIELLDHLIVNGTSFLSFKDKGHL